MAVTTYLLTIDGCPYSFSTAGTLPTLPTGSSDFPQGITSAQVLTGYLVPPDLSWTERLKPLEGDLEVSGIALRVMDARTTINGTVVNPATWLFTRNDQDRSQLAQTITATATTLTVNPPSGIFTGTNFTVWLEQEAILVSSITGNTMTVSQRGYLGTRATAHTVDTANNYYPTVWQAYPGPTKRRALLWAYDASTSSWSVLYRGYCNKAPRLTGNGSVIELQIEHTLTTFKQGTVNIPVASTRLCGVAWDSVGTQITFQEAPFFHGLFQHPQNQTYETDTRTPYSLNLRTALYECNLALQAQLMSNGYAFQDSYFPAPAVNTNGKLDVVFGLNGTLLKPVTNLAGTVAIGRTYTKAPKSGKDRDRGVDLAVVQIDNMDVVERINPYLATSYLHVNSFNDLPTAWTLSGSLGTALVQDALSTDLADQGRRVVFLPSQSLGTTVPRKLKGNSLVKPLKADSQPIPAGGAETFITTPAEFSYKKLVSADHWLAGVRYGLVDGFSDNRNWDWSGYDATKTYGSVANFNGVEWLLDNNFKLYDKVSGYCKFFACAPSITGSGKLTITPIRRPTPWEVPAAVISKTDFVANPTWGLAEDGIVNSITVKSDLFQNFTVNNQASRADFDNTGYSMTIDITGMSREIEIATDKAVLVAYLNNRYFDLFSRAYATATFTVNLSWFSKVYLGNIITVTDWLIPNGSGSRALAGYQCLVVGKTTNLGKGTVALEVLMFPPVGTTGYSPCLRISAIDIPNKKLSVATGYLSTGTGTDPTDYAGSNLTGYSGTANDGGTSAIKAGDRVQLVLRNSTALNVLSLTVASVAGTNIVVNEVIPDLSTDLAAGNVDLRYDKFDTAGLQAAQQQYAWIGSQTSGYIGTGTTKRNQRFSS